MAGEIYCATVLYPFVQGVDFDVDYYARDIAPRYAQLLGDNCLGFEVREGRASPGSAHPDHVCIASFWVRSAEAFGASLGTESMKGLMAEIGGLSSIRPVRQFDVCRIGRYPG
jgi:hypothetical protein